jgi:hypothetical protein
VAERSLLVGLRPVLAPSRDDDSQELVRFGDGQTLRVRGHGGAIAVGDSAVYLAMALRNGGSGLAVIHGWRVKPRPGFGETPADADVLPPLDQFRRQQIDLYIPPGDTGSWLGALRDPSEPIYDVVRQAARSRDGLQIDLLYGDHEGGQRTVTRFTLGAWPEDEDQGEQSRRVIAVRYWNLDREDPR